MGQMAWSVPHLAARALPAQRVCRSAKQRSTALPALPVVRRAFELVL
jgi:hypothetical protein